MYKEELSVAVITYPPPPSPALPAQAGLEFSMQTTRRLCYPSAGIQACDTFLASSILLLFQIQIISFSEITIHEQSQQRERGNLQEREAWGQNTAGFSSRTHSFQHVTLILMSLTSSSVAWICTYRIEMKYMGGCIFMLLDVKCMTRDSPRGKVYGCFHRCEKGNLIFS